MISTKTSALPQQRIVEESHQPTFSVNSSVQEEALHILYVDDDASLLHVSKMILESENNFFVDTATSADSAFEKLRTKSYDAIVSDYEMPKKNGLDFLKEIREQSKDIPFILFTGKGREEIVVSALNLGADSYVNKNGSPETVYCELADAISKSVIRKKNDLEIAQKNEALERVAESIDAGLAVISKDYRVIWANRRLRDLVSESNKKCYQIFNNLNAVCPNCGAKKVFEQNVCLDVHEFKTVNSKGETVWVELRVTPFKDKNGTTVAALELAVPITERKKAEEESSKIREEYISLFANMMDGFALCQMIFDEENQPVDFIYLEINDAFEKITGLKREIVVGNKVTEAIPGIKESNPELFEIYGRVAKSRKAEKFEVFFKPLNKWLSISVYSPEKGYFAAIFEDTSERKKANEAIKFQADLLNHVGQAVIMADDKRAIRFWNKAAEKLYGWSEEQALGHEVTDLLGVTSKEENDEVRNRLMTGESWSIEGLATNRNGSVVPVILNRTPIYNEKSMFVGAASIATDITLQKQTAADLTVALDSLSNSLNKIKELNEKLRVVGDLSRHDVRNKLSIVTGLVYILKKKYSNQADIMDGLSKMEIAIEESVKIFNFAKMYEQLGVVELIEIDVGKAMDEAVALFSGLTFNVINECHGKFVRSDSFLRQMFYNFIDNTKKHGEKATTIKVRCEKAESDKLQLIYEDDGVGIPSENKTKLFSESFSTNGSTGFGLFLIKKMMDVYNWSITEEGESGKGAKFIITIP